MELFAKNPLTIFAKNAAPYMFDSVNIPLKRLEFSR